MLFGAPGVPSHANQSRKRRVQMRRKTLLSAPTASVRLAAGSYYKNPRPSRYDSSAKAKTAVAPDSHQRVATRLSTEKWPVRILWKCRNLRALSTCIHARTSPAASRIGHRWVRRPANPNRPETTEPPSCSRRLPLSQAPTTFNANAILKGLRKTAERSMKQ